MIEFVYEGVTYHVSDSAFDVGRIVLPDGRVLELEGWSKMDPPIPTGFTEVSHIFGNLPLGEIAQNMYGILVIDEMTLGLLRVQAGNWEALRNMPQAHWSNIGPHTEDNPSICMHCGLPEEEWVEGVACVPTKK